MRASGMGAKVIVTEMNPLRALEAVMDGYQVMSMEKAAPIGDFFCTLTGDIHVLRKEHFEMMKDGAIVCNSGHFNVEINLDDLREMSSSVRQHARFCRRIQSEKRQKNLRAWRRPPYQSGCRGGTSFERYGHELRKPGAVFGIYGKNHASLKKQVYRVPMDIDREIARLKLASMGIKIDSLTSEQDAYLHSWEMGT